MNLLIGALNNYFFLINEDIDINFNKTSTNVFNLIKHYYLEELWVLTGPGSFVGTRSAVSFALGYTFNSKIQLKGFNVLLDLIPLIYNDFLMLEKTSSKEILFFFNELNRFFYCIYEKDLINRKFFLLSYEELEKYKDIYYLVGNHSISHIHLPINKSILYNLIKKYINNLSETSIQLEYCGKFLI